MDRNRLPKICQGFSLHHQAALPLGRRLRRRLGRAVGLSALEAFSAELRNGPMKAAIDVSSAFGD
jgi:hypothetical protein